MRYDCFIERKQIYDFSPWFWRQAWLQWKTIDSRSKNSKIKFRALVIGSKIKWVIIGLLWRVGRTIVVFNWVRPHWVIQYRSCQAKGLAYSRAEEVNSEDQKSYRTKHHQIWLKTPIKYVSDSTKWVGMPRNSNFISL